MGTEASSMLYSGTRAKRLIFGACFAGVALYCDHGAPQGQRALIQAGLWWAAPIVLLVIEARGVLERPRLRHLSMIFALIHTCIVYSVWVKKLPYDSSLTVLFFILVEYLMLFVALLRIGQEVDPEGPLGLTEAERQARTIRPLGK
jgi:hypothetical protein